MASPFEIFRKNQRLWMAAAVLVAIISFVIAPMLQYFMDGGTNGRSGPNPVVASWSGGAMRVVQIEQDQKDLQLVNRFLRELYSKVDENGGVPKVPSFFPQQNMFGITPYQSILDPEVIIDRRLLQTEAQRMGIQFDDDAVTQFLTRFVDGKLDGKTIQKLMLTSTERRLTMPMFQRVMKDELVYQEMMRLMRAGLNFEDVRNSQIVAMPALTTPSKNWREYLRLNRTAKIKAYPVYVKDFLAEVKTKPSDKELKDLYAAGSGMIRMSNTLESAPAFMTPAMADFEFLSIDTEKFVQEEMAKIPEATLRSEYERRVAEKQFRVPIEAPKNDASGLPNTADPAVPSGSTPTGDRPTTPPSLPSPDGAVDPAETVKPVEPSTAPATEPAVEAPKGTPSETPVVPSIDAPKGPGKEPPKSSSLNRPEGQIRLVSYQEEKPTVQPLADSPAPTAPAPAPATPVQATPSVPAVTPDVATPALENPLREQIDAPANASDTPRSTETTKPVDQPPTTEKPGVPTLPSMTLGDSVQPANPSEPIADSTPMRTQTFDEVKDRIARELATATATSIVEDKVREVYGMMNIYQSERYQYLRAVQEKVPDTVEPEKLDLKKIAADYGFDYGTTGMVDSETVMFHPIGQSAVSINPRAQPVPIGAFIQATQEKGATWTPLISTSRMGQSAVQYLSWKTELKEPEVPSFDVCKDKVTEVWTAQQALKLVEAKAADLASRIGSGQIEEILSSEEDKKKVLEPAPFTAMNPMYPMFMRFNMQAQMDEVGNVAPLQPVDMNFMEAVFSKKPGEATFAPDRRKSVFYVIKVLEMGETKELLTKFQASPAEGVSALVSRDNDRVIGPMMDGIRKRLGYRAY
ncbi:MAG: hypothetical protein ACK57V_17930 [Pirellula sp.]